MSRPSRAARPCCHWLGEEEEGIPWREGVRQNSKLLRGEIALTCPLMALVV